MAKKKDDKKVVELPSRETETPKELTQEEIDYIQQRDEEEISGFLKKFKSINNVADSSKVEEEEDEEEETFTVDLNQGVAYEKKEEILVGDDLLEQIQNAIGQSKPKLQVQFADLISERFTSKAIASLIEKLNKAEEEAFKATNNALKYFPGSEVFAEEATTSIEKRKAELRRSWQYGKVNYDNIPQWAEGYIKEYIENAINSMLDFTERS